MVIGSGEGASYNMMVMAILRTMIPWRGYIVGNMTSWVLKDDNDNVGETDV